MVAWLIRASTTLGEQSEIWVRMPAIFLSFGLSGIVYFWANKIYPHKRRIRFKIVVLLNVILIFAVGGVVVTPDTPLVFFFTLTLFWLYKANFEKKSIFWIFAGLTFGLALLSKYTALLLFPCLALFLFFSNANRFWLQRKEPYLFAATAFLIFSPVLFWNASNGWVSLRFQLGHGFFGKPVNPIASFIEYLGGQFLIVTPIVFAGLVASIGFCYYLWVREKDDRLLFLFCFSAPIFLFFGIVSFQSKVEGNWPVIAYVPAILAMVGLEAKYRGGGQTGSLFRFLKKWALTSAIAIFLAVHLQTIWRIAPLPDPSLKRAYGWKLLGDRAGGFLHNYGGGTTAISFVFAKRHGIAGETAFYIPGQPDTYVIHGGRRYSFLGNLENLAGKNGLYIVQADRGEMEEIIRYFDRVEELPPLPIVADGRVFRIFRMFRCINYKGGLIET
tara:strand:- start:2011 stop:3342 length:1332 start_codon:yes stop_codon:yes gene_type:complete